MALSHRLAVAEARIAILEKTPAANIDAMTARIDRLEQMPAAQSDARLGAAEAALAALRQALDTRVGALEKKDASEVMRRAAAAIALDDLIRASDTGGAFTRELASLRLLLPESAEARDLSRYAVGGVPNEAMLAAQFSDIAGDAVAAERKARSRSWLGRIWANIASLVTIRRIGEVKGNDTQSRLARAGVRLKAHDLAAAIGEMRALGQPARTVVAPWLNQAEARLAVDRDTAALSDTLVLALAAPQAKIRAMMRLIFILIGAGLVAAGIAWIVDQQGELLFTIGHYEARMSASVTIALVVLFAALIGFLTRLAAAILSGPGAIGAWFSARRSRRGNDALSRGLVAVAAGDPFEARRQTQKARDILGDHPLALLLTAQAAQLEGDGEGQRAAYHAMRDHAETEFLGLRGLFMLAMREDDKEQALSLAARAHALKPRALWAANALFDLKAARGAGATPRMCWTT